MGGCSKVWRKNWARAYGKLIIINNSEYNYYLVCSIYQQLLTKRNYQRASSVSFNHQYAIIIEQFMYLSRFYICSQYFYEQWDRTTISWSNNHYFPSMADPRVKLMLLTLLKLINSSPSSLRLKSLLTLSVVVDYFHSINVHAITHVFVIIILCFTCTKFWSHSCSFRLIEGPIVAK